MMRKALTSLLAFAALTGSAETLTINMADYGVKPDRKENISAKLTKALDRIKAEHKGDTLTLRFLAGRYEFHEKGAPCRELYISNHDQDNPKKIGIDIDGWDNLTIDAEGADFIFHGRMLPVTVTGSRNFTIKNLHIDFDTPHITQVEVVANGEEGITFRTAPWVKADIDKKGKFAARGEGWTLTPSSGIAFEKDTRRVVYRTSDLWIPLDSVVKADDKNLYMAPSWKDGRLKEGTIVAMRGWGRPTPGIFLSEDSATMIENVKVHYAEGMGLLAQLCDDITLKGFGVCLRGEDDPRYFTTQADATHFSGCRGLISSTGGLYEGMMDDAINVHGTYLKVTDIKDRRTLTGRYMHGQSYGFKWGDAGDSIQIILSETMEALPCRLTIASIVPSDKPTTEGAKEFTITFNENLPEEVKPGGNFGLENLTWCPEVYFADNTVRNNRARGSLFSTPRKTVVERNLFDHTSGTAILLCGDCMGWFETGACRDVTIRNNRFVNALTNMFQFTEAVISIYPEIHNLEGQQEYFHSGIRIEENEFDTFDAPLLYAKSVDGLSFTGNKVSHNSAYKPFHKNRFTFRLQRTRNVIIENNDFSGKDPSVSVE